MRTYKIGGVDGWFDRTVRIAPGLDPRTHELAADLAYIYEEGDETFKKRYAQTMNYYYNKGVYVTAE